MYDILEQHRRSQHILISVLRIPNAEFLVYLPCGSLDRRLRSHQVRRSPLANSYASPRPNPTLLVATWLYQLLTAVEG